VPNLSGAASPRTDDATDRAGREREGIMDPATARGIAHYSHSGQRTRFGNPLTEHVERVASAVPQHARSVAYLHDVLENSPIAITELVDQGLTPLELAALTLLTREPSDSYELHVLRIAHAPGAAGSLARAVKLADLEDHLGEARAVPGTPPYAWARRHIEFARDRRGERAVAAVPAA
jgi:hypothetical protein